VADVETLRLPPDAYDLVIAWMALHHVEHVLRLVQEVKRALRPGGVFVVNEYVGPARFQMPGAQASLINEWLMRLPEELRRTPSGEVRDGFTPPTIEEVIAADPSEAVNSDQILPALERCFSTLERTDYGGPLLNWLLHDLTQNFDPENDEHRAWLQRLFAAEREVLNSGQLKSDFSFVIAEKPDGDGVTR
jgi:SAM-dependent methyltransferase